MEGGASPASLLSDEKLPKSAQMADYHRKPQRAPVARSTVTLEVFISLRTAYGYSADSYNLLGHFLIASMKTH